MNDIYVKPPVNDQLAYILQWGVDFSEHEHRRQVEQLKSRVARLIAQEVVSSQSDGLSSMYTSIND